MGLVDYTLDEHIAIVTMNNGENRFNDDFFSAFNRVLDEIEHETDARVVIVKSAHEKIWSNGIDLDWIRPVIQSKPEKAKEFMFELIKLYKRLLFYPMVTIAAITGHAFAGGAIMAAAFDFRFMRSDRGFFCLPEVDIGIPLTPSMIAIMKKAVPMYKFLEMQYLGLRLSADECEKHNIIIKSFPIDELMDGVLNFARPHNKDREMVGTMKKLTYQYFNDMFDVYDPVWVNSGKTGLI